MAARILGSASADLCDADRLDDWLHVPSPARVGERLEVYAGGYPARVHDALAESYPVVANVLGHCAFHALSQRYATAVPLTSYNLNHAGAGLAAFLRADAVAQELPFLPDLAALEWHVARAFHAADGAPLDPRALGWSVDDWGNAVLHFQPSVAVIASEWPLLDLWASRETPRDTAEVTRLAQSEHLVIRRVDLVVRCEAVSAAEAQALRGLLDGRCLAAVAGRLEADGFDPAEVLTCFGRWVGEGMIAFATAAARGGMERAARSAL
jgi:uncharacterized protein